MRLALPLLATLLCLHATAQTNPEQDPAGGLAGMAGQVEVVDDNDPFQPNAFSGSFRMEMHLFKDGMEVPEGPGNIHFWSSPEMTLMSMAAQHPSTGPTTDMKVLTDFKGKWTYFLMTDPKGTKTAMKSRKKKFITNAGGTSPQGRFTVTKETRIIDGHSCTKVIGTTEDGTWTGWVAKDIAVPFSDLAPSLNRGASAQGGQDWEGLPGFPLEFEMSDKEGRKTMECFVKDLWTGDVDPSVFSMAGFKVMEVPGIQR
ncbi:MAG: DUF4412 domain-containing protein [Flavobacteriales bacterium]|nr:DUF4412 domain-containing protein [Flavobacteriales bacterium]MBP9081042.1 DUF4412 domain-containing protein [Flavobacteriales bacterium]